jgi:hypothetical protein
MAYYPQEGEILYVQGVSILAEKNVLQREMLQLFLGK